MPARRQRKERARMKRTKTKRQRKRESTQPCTPSSSTRFTQTLTLLGRRPAVRRKPLKYLMIFNLMILYISFDWFEYCEIRIASILQEEFTMKWNSMPMWPMYKGIGNQCNHISCLLLPNSIVFCPWTTSWMNHHCDCDSSVLQRLYYLLGDCADGGIVKPQFMLHCSAQRSTSAGQLGSVHEWGWPVDGRGSQGTKGWNCVCNCTWLHPKWAVNNSICILYIYVYTIF